MPDYRSGQTVDNSERLLLTATGKRLPIIKTVRPVVIAGRQLLLESFVDISARKEAGRTRCAKARIAIVTGWNPVRF